MDGDGRYSSHLLGSSLQQLQFCISIKLILCIGFYFLWGGGGAYASILSNCNLLVKTFDF